MSTSMKFYRKIYQEFHIYVNSYMESLLIDKANNQETYFRRTDIKDQI